MGCQDPFHNLTRALNPKNVTAHYGGPDESFVCQLRLLADQIYVRSIKGVDTHKICRKLAMAEALENMGRDDYVPL